MEVKVNREAVKDRPFPKMMRLEQTIVLFEEFGCGVCLQTNPYSKRKVGLWYTDWTMNDFKDFEGSVTLSN